MSGRGIAQSPAQAPSPVLFARPRAGRSSNPSRDHEGSGAPANAEVCETSRAAGAAARHAGEACPLRLRSRRGASRRSTGGDLCPRGRSFRAGAGASWPPISRPAFASLCTRRVQPLKADPRSGTGRLPGASRGRGYEPRTQAPRPAPSSLRLRKTPLDERDKRTNSLGLWACQAPVLTRLLSHNRQV